MPQTTDTRIHPIAALRAIRNLLHKQGDTRQVFLIIDALRGKTTLRSDPAAIDDAVWFRERNREMHDLLHVVTGYGRDALGEACLLGFSYAQTGQKGFAAIALFAARRIAQARPGYPIRRAIFEGYRRGRRAGWLIAADWEGLLDQPVSAIRDSFRVGPARIYPEIVAALRRAGDSAVGAAPAAAMMG